MTGNKEVHAPLTSGRQQEAAKDVEVAKPLTISSIFSQSGAPPPQTPASVHPVAGQPPPLYSTVGDPSGPKIPKYLRGPAVRNTVATRPAQDPDRHCYRRSGGGSKAMKCEECEDYNRGVAERCCQVCGHTNSVFERN